MKQFTLLTAFYFFALFAHAQNSCGSIFVDSGGVTGNYSNSTNSTTTICPDNPGEIVTVTFTQFATESNWDGMYVHNGNATSSPLIPSSNPPGMGGQLSTAGAYWGTTIPGPFVSTSIDGCLTFRFVSDGTGTYAGWIANVTCAPAPTCLEPTGVAITALTATSATLAWDATDNAVSWEVLILAATAGPPSSSEEGEESGINSYSITALTAGASYNAYVKAICDDGFSEWSDPFSFTAPANPLTVSGALTLQQLITDVLIGNPCFDISNFTATSGAYNSIGSFNNSNPLFPITNGIVLTTGNINDIPGPNNSVLSSGGGPGDPELDAFIIAGTGDPMTSFNASSLGFDFVSATDYLSFNFVFASEEYGTYQCSFSDAVVFLLTDNTTGITTNIATVPGTSIPIAATTIRDSEFNGGCTSVNPQYFGSFFGGVNAGISPTDFNGQTVEMTASATIVPGNSYNLRIVIADRNDAAYDSAVFIEGGSFSTGNTWCEDRLQLIAFVDDNGNNIKDDNEGSFNYGSFTHQMNNAGPVSSIIAPTGVYSIFDNVPTNTYDINYVINPEYAGYYATAGTSYGDVSVVEGSGTQVLYFPITLTQAYGDLSVNIISLNSPRPGFEYSCKIEYQNLGVQIVSGTLTFEKDPLLSISGNSQVGTNTTATGFTYDFTDLLPYETRSMIVTFDVPNAPVVNMDDVLVNQALVTQTIDDINSANNSFVESQIVVASYDPNDKYESHGGEIPIDQFAADDYLYYTIRFQNIGTASAINVRIEDMLDSQIDASTIRMVSASHDYVMQRIGHDLTWNFDDIYLPGIIENEALSQGYVTFKVQLQPGFAVGDIIPNTAEIYFDTNAEIVTNTFTTEFVTQLAVADISIDSIRLYPNPANSIVHISAENKQISNVTVYDMLGKALIQQENLNLNETALDVSNLSKGIYTVVIMTAENLKSVKKLIVQ